MVNRQLVPVAEVLLAAPALPETLLLAQLALHQAGARRSGQPASCTRAASLRGAAWVCAPARAGSHERSHMWLPANSRVRFKQRGPGSALRHPTVPGPKPVPPHPAPPHRLFRKTITNPHITNLTSPSYLLSPPAGVKVERSAAVKDELILTGNDIELVSRSTSLIRQVSALQLWRRSAARA